MCINTLFKSFKAIQKGIRSSWYDIDYYQSFSESLPESVLLFAELVELPIPPSWENKASLMCGRGSLSRSVGNAPVLDRVHSNSKTK